MKRNLYQVCCSGYSDIFVLALSFDDAITRWQNEYINTDEDGKPIEDDQKIRISPNSVIYIADFDQILV